MDGSGCLSRWNISSAVRPEQTESPDGGLPTLAGRTRQLKSASIASNRIELGTLISATRSQRVEPLRMSRQSVGLRSPTNPPLPAERATNLREPSRESDRQHRPDRNVALIRQLLHLVRPLLDKGLIARALQGEGGPLLGILLFHKISDIFVELPMISGERPILPHLQDLRSEKPIVSKIARGMNWRLICAGPFPASWQAM